jgi:L-serine dehydratase
MAISVFDLFSIGIGPSSSHTVGPMRAARMFTERLAASGALDAVARVHAELFGSLGATGHGHGSVGAVVLGLMGQAPESVDVDAAPALVAAVRAAGALELHGGRRVPFDVDTDVVMHRRRTLPLHPNGMRFAALDAAGVELEARIYYSVGGGFVAGEDGAEPVVADTTPLPLPFATGAELLAHTREHGIAISEVMRRNELVRRSDPEVHDGLIRIWEVMQACVRRGCGTEGVLPGGLKVERRAHGLHAQLTAEAGQWHDPLHAMDWVNLYALAVNEENASGGRVVTAPTNGAAGIIPAVLHYYRNFVPGSSDEGVVRFLLTAGAIGVIYKTMASISGAEVGCQGEVGSACSMAAAGLTEVMGGSPEQVENAAEIAMEHNLGLTCDPVGGLVQIPCIERNAMAAVKAINATRMALRGNGTHVVSLDNVIKTMRETGADMKIKYKETSRGGLAVNVIEC